MSNTIDPYKKGLAEYRGFQIDDREERGQAALERLQFLADHAGEKEISTFERVSPTLATIIGATGTVDKVEDARVAIRKFVIRVNVDHGSQENQKLIDPMTAATVKGLLEAFDIKGNNDGYFSVQEIERAIQFYNSHPYLH